MLLKKNKLEALLEELSQETRVYVPTDASAEAKSCFSLYKKGDTPAFDLVNTTMPPKDLLFPQTQKMYRYGFDDEGNACIEMIHDANDAIVFGIRSCDVRSIECMDDVFFTKGYGDEFYGMRRNHLTTVAIGCAAVNEVCFCDSMGLDPNAAPAADIQLSPTADGQAYQVKAQTERGSEALKRWQPYLEDGDAPLTNVACELKVNTVGIKDKLNKMFEHPLWEEIAKKCLTCGTCCYECPTCHCFDISQQNRMKDGERFRTWDTCMFSIYSEMAGNHNPRSNKASRVRQRFMHKLCFFEERYGKMLCVGCGRCVADCPVGVDITCIIDEINQIGMEA